MAQAKEKRNFQIGTSIRDQLTNLKTNKILKYF